VNHELSSISFAAGGEGVGRFNGCCESVIWHIDNYR